MRYKNNFVIHTTEQLIDINKGLVDFEAQISITSQNEDDDFDIVVVTQQQLDDQDFKFNYKNISHYVSVNVKSKRNEPNDFVLVIKSSKKINVDIDINLKDLNETETQENTDYTDKLEEENFEEIIEESESEDEDEDEEINDIVEQYRESNIEQKKSYSKYFKYLKYVALVLILGVGAYFLFFKLKKRNKDKTIKSNEEGEGGGYVSLPREESVVEEASTPVSPNVKKSKRSNKSKKVAGDESLLEQLRKLRESKN